MDGNIRCKGDKHVLQLRYKAMKVCLPVKSPQFTLSYSFFEKKQLFFCRFL